MTVLKIISFNILGEPFIDYSDLSVDYPNVSAKTLKLKTRLPKILAYLDKSKADIMMLQEVTPATHKIIKAHLVDYRVFPLSKHQTEEAQTKGNAYGNTTVIRKTLCKKTKHLSLTVPYIGSTFDITYTDISEPSLRSEQRVLFVNIHLDSDQSERKRRAEIKLLTQYLKPHLGALPSVGTYVIVLAGDFNTNNKITHKKFNKFTSVVKNPKGTYLSEKSMIDWIYVYGGRVIDGKVDRPEVGDNTTPLKKYGSDHYPVVGRFKIE